MRPMHAKLQRECLRLFMTPIFLDIVLEMQLMWFFQVRHSSVSTPRNFVNFTRSSDVLSSVTLKSSRVLVDVMKGAPTHFQKFVKMLKIRTIRFVQICQHVVKRLAELYMERLKTFNSTISNGNTKCPIGKLVFVVNLPLKLFHASFC